MMLSLAGCGKFLEEKTYSFISGDDLYKDETGLTAALTGIYNVLIPNNIQGTSVDMWGKHMQYLTGLGTDELINANTSQANEPSLIYLASFDYNVEADAFYTTWFGLYVGIDRANNLIEKAPAVDMDPAIKEQMIAEAKFLRGYFQFCLAFLWGGVPAPRQPLEDPRAPRLSLETVYDYIIDDLKEAYQILPARNAKSGRVDKWCAAGMLGKVYLYLASCKEYGVGNDLGAVSDLEINSFSWVDHTAMYIDAEKVLQDTYDNSAYTMISPYKHLFYWSTYSSVAKDETMFSAMCAPGTGSYLVLNRLWSLQGPNSTGQGYGWVRPLNELTKKYHPQDPRRAHNITGHTPEPVNTELVGGLPYPVPNVVNAARANECFGKIRNFTPDINTSLAIPAWASVYSWPLLRFADVALMYAEVLYKNNKEATARTVLHAVRLRSASDATFPITVNAIQYPNAEAFATFLDDYYKKTDMVEELLDERSRELCGESWRRIDLIRTGQLANAIDAIDVTTTVAGGNGHWNTNNNIARNMKANYAKYKIWYPIPKRELEVNRNLVQNAGYVAEQ